MNGQRDPAMTEERLVDLENRVASLEVARPKYQCDICGTPKSSLAALDFHKYDLHREEYLRRRAESESQLEAADPGYHERERRLYEEHERLDRKKRRDLGWWGRLMMRIRFLGWWGRLMMRIRFLRPAKGLNA